MTKIQLTQRMTAERIAFWRKYADTLEAWRFTPHNPPTDHPAAFRRDGDDPVTIMYILQFMYDRQQFASFDAWAFYLGRLTLIRERLDLLEQRNTAP